MTRDSDTGEDPRHLRDRIIGLGDQSIRKSYYPQLQKQIEELEQSKKDLENRSAALLNILEDLEEARRVAEENLEKFHTMADFTYDWEYWQGPDGDLIYVSPSCERLTGYSPEEFLKNPDLIREIVHPDDSAGFNAHLHRIISDPLVDSIDFRILRRDGALRWLAQTCQPVITKDKRRQGVRVSNRDITDRKEAEDLLRLSEQRLNDIINFLPDATLAINREGNIIAWNRAMELLSGVSASGMLGKGNFEYGIPIYGERRPLLLNLVLDDDEETRKRYPGIQKAGDKYIAELNIPTLYQGKGAYVLCIASPLYDTEGRITGAIESVRDVTERKRMENALNQARKKLNLLNAITFSDIQNSIFSLSGYLQLQKNLHADEQLLRYTDKEIGLVQTVSDSLKYANIYQSLGLKSPVWQNVSQSFLIGISHLDISKVSRRLDIGELEIYADPMLENVFFALADNVIEHARTATGYSLTYTKRPEELVLIFEDNGQGIQQDLKEKIFEREYSRRKGLGLFLSREILSITGITISETGEPGKGARFEMAVPKGMYRFSPDRTRGG